jgi:hypothetical protein
MQAMLMLRAGGRLASSQPEQTIQSIVSLRAFHGYQDKAWACGKVRTTTLAHVWGVDHFYTDMLKIPYKD